MDSNERFFEVVRRSHKFFLLISCQREVIHVYRWTKTYALGSKKRGRGVNSDVDFDETLRPNP